MLKVRPEAQTGPWEIRAAPHRGATSPPAGGARAAGAVCHQHGPQPGRALGACVHRGHRPGRVRQARDWEAVASVGADRAGGPDWPRIDPVTRLAGRSAALQSGVGDPGSGGHEAAGAGPRRGRRRRGSPGGVGGGPGSGPGPIVAARGGWLAPDGLHRWPRDGVRWCVEGGEGGEGG